MNTLHIKKDDNVIVISGDDKGKRGKVIGVALAYAVAGNGLSFVRKDDAAFLTAEAGTSHGASSHPIVQK